MVNHDTTTSYVFVFAPKAEFDRVADRNILETSLSGLQNDASEKEKEERAMAWFLRDRENEEERNDAENATLDELKSRVHRQSWQRR